MSELSCIPRRPLSVRVSGAERMPPAPAPARCLFSLALIALLASSSSLLTPGAKLQVHLSSPPQAKTTNVCVP